MTPAATSADVCYRHPNRESWTLCSRCGRTICPECQILTPSGVQCPDCVTELGGSVRWQSATPKPAPKPSPKAARQRARADRAESGSGWRATVGRLLNPGSTRPAASWAILGTLVALWIVGFFVPGQLQAGLPFDWLAARPDAAIQLWRYVTAAVAFPSVASFGVILSLLLSVVFFALLAPAVESLLGRTRFLWVFFAGTALGATAMILAGGFAFGLTGGLFALFGAYLIRIWSYPPARVQVLIMIGINLVFSLVQGGATLPNLIGGLVAGAGAAFLFQRYEDRPRAARTPYLIIGAVIAAFVLIAVLRSLLS